MPLEEKLQIQEHKIIMDPIILKMWQLKEHPDTMCAVLIAKREDTFYKILTKYLKIVLIFVNSLISVILKTEKVVESFGKLYLNSRNMLFMIVLNLDVISAIRKNFNIWREHSFSIILRQNARKLWFNVLLVAWSLQEEIMLLMNVLRTSSWRD